MRETDLFSFEYDAAIGAVCATLRGVWTPGTVNAYGQTIRAAIAAAPAGWVATRALYDVRECQLHGRGVADALVDFHARVTPMTECAAIVVTSALAAMQARRISQARVVRCFGTIEAAKAWIAETALAAAA